MNFPSTLSIEVFPEPVDPPGDKKIFPGKHIPFELVGEPAFQGSGLNQILDTEVARVEFADCQSHSVHTARWDDRCHTAPIAEPRIEDRFRLRNIAAQSARNLLYRV